MLKSLKKPFAMIAALLLLIMVAAPAMAVEPEPGPFFDTWARTDKPVADDVVDRTWVWGPEANTEVLQEPYEDSPGGTRSVQYFDKSRMEINDPDAVNDGLWYVTNGLLVVELMTGMMQVGDEEFVEREPAEINIVGDPGFPETPTYADYADLQDTPAFIDGSVITATVDGDGNVGSDESRAQFNVTAGVLAEPTGHRTASVFWEFMTSTGVVYENGEFVTDQLFQNPYYATGYPITEAYWSNVMVAGSEQWVLTQAFERRVLTYTPSNNAGFQVEAGNVGLHYYEWRYDTPAPPADTTNFHVEFGALNESGVSGYAELTLTGDQLTVMIEASGLDADQTHAQHIHGFEDFANSVCPTSEMAGDDGVLTLEEGVPAYGGVVLSLEEFPTADADGNISFEGTFTLALTPEQLTAHTIVLHGMTINGEYDGSLPVACGEIVEGDRMEPPAGEVEAQAFAATLTVEAEVPEPTIPDGSNPSGDAVVYVNAEGNLEYSLYVVDIQNVTAAHIHVAPVGEAGPVVVTLFMAGEGEAVSVADGEVVILASGEITAGDLADMDLGDLLALMEAGNTYVNVHTEQNKAGEIRGQLELISDASIDQ